MTLVEVFLKLIMRMVCWTFVVLMGWCGMLWLLDSDHRPINHPSGEAIIVDNICYRNEKFLVTDDLLAWCKAHGATELVMVR